jgi:signal transduction histidine kinase
VKQVFSSGFSKVYANHRLTGSLSNELYQISNVALLCEEIVYGMMAAKEFQGITESSSPQKPLNHKNSPDSQVQIILDFEHRDWNYRIQSGEVVTLAYLTHTDDFAGALRRIIMNIFGNANKYTDSGFIIVQLRVREIEQRDAAGSTCQHMLVMRIIDSGRGMSTEYMERKLYTPFAQEDSFSPGIGLGLSIV